MARVAKEIRFNGTVPTTPVTSYDPDKVNLGTFMYQRTGAGGADNYVGPLPCPVARPVEDGTTAHGTASIHAFTYSPAIDWIFLGDADTGTTHRAVLYEFNKITAAWTYKGFITMQTPGAPSSTMRSIRGIYSTYITGTASVSGTAVTGTGTAWSTDRINVGNRIGFGSTDPLQITTWYEISAVGGDTSITLTSSAGTIADGPYVIEDLQVAYTVSGTGTNLYLAKGLRYENFIPAGTTITTGGTIDNLNRVYKLSASVGDPSNPGSIALDEYVSRTEQRVYFIDGLTALRIWAFNLREPLTGLSGGVSTSAFIFRTANYQQSYSAGSQNGQARVLTIGHGSPKGEKSLFSQIGAPNRAAVSQLIPDYAFWVTDTASGGAALQQIFPPGGSSTYALQAGTTMNLKGVDYIALRDRFIFGMGLRTSGHRGFYGQWKANIGPMDKIWGALSDQNHPAGHSSDLFPHPNSQGGSANTGLITFTPLSNVTYILRLGTTAAINQLYAVPFVSHWDYKDAEIITPRLFVADASKLYNLYVSDVRKLGNNDGAISPEPYRTYFRTSGIKDNSGAWYELPADGDLGSVKGNEIQFRFDFKTIGNYCVPARVHGLTLSYERTDDLPTNYRWNFTDSSALNGVFGFIQLTSFGGGPPTHTIEIRRLDNEKLLITQGSGGATTHGVFEYWSGTAWLSGLGPDTIGTRRRFRTTGSIPGGIDLYAKILI